MEIMHNKKATETACHEDNGKVKDGSTTGEADPWNPPYTPDPPGPRDPGLTDEIDLIEEMMRKKEDFLAASRATNTIFPDRTPQSVNDAFFDKLPLLVSILEKDSVKLFLNLFKRRTPGLAWGFVITPQTFNYMIVHNALKCAKVALEGKSPQLGGYRANPNYMNSHGYFPLHQAAELFAVDMIKLLFQYGASANLCTAGPDVTKGLLPLHVAVENTCRHKFLEDNLFPDKENRDYIYRLIHLLCLPEMKIFLDTTRLIAERTDNLLDELWKYIKDGKLAESAVLLLAAQKKIRVGSSFKTNGNSVPDGFAIILNRITVLRVGIESEILRNRRGKKQLEANKRIARTSMWLVHVISEAGEALDAYIRGHPEVPHALQVSHVEVLERVSSILKSCGFHPTGEHINTENLCPYERKLSRLSDEDLPDKDIGYSTAEKGSRKKQSRGWELKYARRSFFPFWKAVLSSQLRAKATMPLVELRSIEETNKIRNKSAGEGSSLISNHSLGLLGRIPQLTSNQQSRRLFGTAALTALKLLKNA